MIDVIACPNCGRKLRLPEELLGKKVRCPGCTKSFRAANGGTEHSDTPPAPPARPVEVQRPPAPQQAAAPSPDPFDFESAPSSARHDDPDVDERSLREARAGWRKVRTGITLIITAILVALGLIFVLILAVFVFAVAVADMVQSANRRGATPTAEPVLGMVVIIGLALLGGLTVFVLRIAGLVYCLAAPPKHGAKGLALATFFLAITSLFLGLGSFALSFAEGATGGGPVAGLGSLVGFVGYLVDFIEGVVFLFFLRAVALGVRNRELAQSIVYMMMMGASALLLFIGMLAVTIVAAAGKVVTAGGPRPVGAGGLEGMPMLIGICGCVDTLLLLGFAIWFFVTLFLVRSAISTHLRRLSTASY